MTAVTRTARSLYVDALDALLRGRMAEVAVARDWELLREIARLAREDAPRELATTDAALFPQNGDGIAGRLSDAASRVYARHRGPLLIVWPSNRFLPLKQNPAAGFLPSQLVGKRQPGGCANRLVAFRF